MPSQIPYRGRFAPSPTGELHFGSLITAVASYLQAKHQHGEWLLRIDDIDPPREQKGATSSILNTLENFGFEWDQDVFYQSHNREQHQDIVQQLLTQKKAYPCSCSRKSIQEKTGQRQGPIIYPGFCRQGPLQSLSATASHSIRLHCQQQTIRFNDLIQGKQVIDLEKSRGDFVIQRSDGYFSYQLASGFDDAEQGITEVVRGADLLSDTSCQIHLQNTLNLDNPQYCHIPVIVNHAGQKLSKQNHAKPIRQTESVSLLHKSLQFLGQNPPPDLLSVNQNEIWSWALSHWQLDLIPKKQIKKANKPVRV